MASRYSNGPDDFLRKYMHINTVAALAMAWNIVMAVYLFGGIDPITWNWIQTVTINQDMAVVGILAGYVAGMLASDTKDPRQYTPWENAIAVTSFLFSLLYLWQPVKDVVATDIIAGFTGEVQMLAAAFVIVGSVVVGR